MRWFLFRAISATEASFGESLEYVRFILRATVGAFISFAMSSSLR